MNPAPRTARPPCPREARVAAERCAITLLEPEFAAGSSWTQVEALNRPERVRVVGCDGLAEEGQAMAARGELVATVVMPPTTPPALQLLGRFWSGGERPAPVLLEASTHPSLDDLC